jgi:hypothetical protein
MKLPGGTHVLLKDGREARLSGYYVDFEGKRWGWTWNYGRNYKYPEKILVSEICMVRTFIQGCCVWLRYDPEKETICYLD